MRFRNEGQMRGHLNTHSAGKILLFLQVLVIAFTVSAIPQTAFSADAIMECYRCPGNASSCNCPAQCTPCSQGGNEGDYFWFDGRSSTGDIMNYTWTLGDGGSSTYSFFAYQYKKPSSVPYVATLTVQDYYGNPPDSTTTNITISNVAPTAYFQIKCSDGNWYDAESAEISGCYLYVNSWPEFNASNSTDRYGSVTAFEWDFNYSIGSFVPSTTIFGAQHQNWQPKTADIGERYIAVRVTDDDAPNALKSIYYIPVEIIPDGPLAKITPPSSAFQEGDVVMFRGDGSIASNAPITTYEWDFNFDGVFGNNSTGDPDMEGMNVNWSFTDDGSYTVALKVTDEFGRTHTAYTVAEPTNKLPVAAFSVSPSLEVYEGEEVTFDASASSAVPGYVAAYYWDFTYDGYTFDLNPNNSGVVKKFTFTEDSMHDSNLYNGTPQEYVIVRLQVRDEDHTAGSPSISYADKTIVVLDVLPEAIISGPSILGQGENGVFNPNQSHSGTDAITLYEWDFEYDGNPDHFTVDASSTTPASKTLSWSALTTVTIGLRITDDDGLKDIVSKSIVIEDRPVSPKVSDLEDFICGTDGSNCEIHIDEGESITFSAEESYIPTGDWVTSYQWDIDYQGVPANFNPWVPYLITDTCNTSQGHCTTNTMLACANNDDCPDGLVRIPYPSSPLDGPVTKYLALRAFDNNAQASELAVVKVIVDNVPPVFDPGVQPNTDAAEGQDYVFVPKVNDPGDPKADFRFECTVKPLTMLCNSLSGRIEWRPASNDVACGAQVDLRHHVVMTVRDGDGGEGQLDYWIRVTNTNGAPEWSTLDIPQLATVDMNYYAIAAADDPDAACGDQLDYSLIGAPAGMTISETSGEINWKPTQNQKGRHDFQVHVEDQDGLSPANWSATVFVQSSEETPILGCGDFANATVQPGKVCLEAEVIANPMEQELEFTWTFKSGPETLWINPVSDDPPTACVAASAHGQYIIQVSAYDPVNEIYSPPATCAITVENVAPGAVVGFTRTYNSGDWIILDGNMSGDYNGDEITYSWTDTYDVLNSTTSPEPGFLAENVASYHFELTVNDGELDSETSDQHVEVVELGSDNKSVADAAPFAYIADYPTTQVNTQVILNASASSSRTGETLTYLWSFVPVTGDPGEPSFGFPSQEDRSKLIFTPTLAGRYTFELQVSALGVLSDAIRKTVYVETDADALPVANAGVDLTESMVLYSTTPRTEYAEVILDGSASLDPDGKTLTYSWVQTYGNPVLLDNPKSASPSFISFSTGLFQFELTVKDGKLYSKPDYVWVVVSKSGNTVPVATIAEHNLNRAIPISPGFPVTLDASGSFDIDSEPLTYHWNQISGPPIPLFADYDSALPTISYTNPIATVLPDVRDMIYKFLMWVDDGNQPSLPLEISIRVLEQQNSPPLCVVAEDQLESKVGEEVTLDGSPSQDPDPDDTMTYIWTQLDDEGDGPHITIVDSDKAVAKVTPIQGGKYVFQLNAFDNYDQQCADVAKIELNVDYNQVPIANAGEDQTVRVGRLVTLDSSKSSDPDGHEIAEYKWEVLEEGNTLGLSTADLEPGSDSPNPTFSAFDLGEVTLQLVVSDGFPGGESQPDTVKITVEYIDGDEETSPVNGDEDADTTEVIETEEKGGGGGGCSSSGNENDAFVILIMLLTMASFVRRKHVS